MPNVPNKQKPSVTATRYPEYYLDSVKWQEWRETYFGGHLYLQKYLQKYSTRETDEDFVARRDITPIPTFAKGAVNDIRNSIFQRLCDVTRRGGSDAYMKASGGELSGVDNNGSSMQSFIGIEVLTELLRMGRCGVYIDNTNFTGNTLADVGDTRPYLYMYQPEDILAWSLNSPDRPGRFKAILLRDTQVDLNMNMGFGVKMPSGTYTRFRMLWIDEITGRVNMMLYNEKDQPIDLDGFPIVSHEPIRLGLTEIPFVLLDIGDSILKDVANHQKALLNLGSSDVTYALRANFPFFIEQKDLRAVGSHLKQTVSDDGTPTTSKNNLHGNERRHGSSHGWTYDLKADAPSFIHPSPEPLLASMKLQEKLEDDIRKLVNLAVQNKQGQRVTSAEALKLSDQGLEAGLSYIGLVLEGAERLIAHHWASYEDRDQNKRKIAVVSYPDRYSLKDNADRIDEASKLSELMDTVPGPTVKKEVAKNIATALLSGKIDVGRLTKIFKEIDDADYTTSNPDTIIRSQEAGLVGEKTASEALGYGPEEYLQAREDHAARAVRILQAQTSAQADMGAAKASAQAGEGATDNSQARGVGDLSAEDTGKQERKVATDPTLNDDKKKPQRGAGKNIKKGDS